MLKNLPANAGDVGEAASIPGRERAPGEGNGNPPHYSCPDDPMDRGVWWATAHGTTESGTGLSRQHSLSQGSQACASPCCKRGPCQRLKQKLSEAGASMLYENLTLREELNHLYLVGGEGWLRGHR